MCWRCVRVEHEESVGVGALLGEPVAGTVIVLEKIDGLTSEMAEHQRAVDVHVSGALGQQQRPNKPCR